MIEVEKKTQIVSGLLILVIVKTGGIRGTSKLIQCVNLTFFILTIITRSHCLEK
jgi:hypothetical protein